MTSIDCINTLESGARLSEDDGFWASGWVRMGESTGPARVGWL
jgi:hypothetical protein